MAASRRPQKPPATRSPEDPVEPSVEADCPEMSAKSGQALPGLTPRQSQAVEALLREANVSRAAAAAGVNERTLRRWLEEPGFRSAWMSARRDAFGQAIGLTQRYAPVAVATLVKVMNDAAVAANAKVTAAGILLKFGREGIEIDDLAERVANLERAAKEGKIAP